MNPVFALLSFIVEEQLICFVGGGGLLICLHQLEGQTTFGKIELERATAR